MLNVSTDYLTQAVDTDVGTVLRAQSSILDFAGQGEEEVVAFSEAVQLAHILIWKEAKQTQKQSVYAHLGMASFLCRDSTSQTGAICPTVHSCVWPPGVVPSSELFAVELCALLCPVVRGVTGTVDGVAQLVRPGRALAELASKCWSAGEK